MILRSIYFLLIVVLTVPSALAQKVKYKDLFILLNAKKYDEAEPFLKKYLKDNDDNPNAYLFMGSILQDKAVKSDILLQTDVMLKTMDSAIFFYNKALQMMTEREINRNEEYYEAYSRRNQRTGKFEITLSDVKFDLEKRMQGLNDKKQRIKTLVDQFHSSQSAYLKVNNAFVSIQDKFSNLKEFYLRSDDKTKDDLRNIISRYDTFLIAFNDYKSTAKLLGKTGYNQVLDQSDIVDFKRDGTSLADFTKDDLKIWDYKRWAMQNLDVIEREVKPVLESLISVDAEINKLREKLIKDSVSVKSELGQMNNKLQASDLKKYDADPLPFAIFDMKISELEYSSTLIENKALKQASDVTKRLAGLKLELASVRKIDSLSVNLLKRNMDAEAENYAHFVTNAYGTLGVLKSLVKATNEYAVREKLKKEEEWEATMQSLKWLLDDKDSIPLFSDALQHNYKFKPLVIVTEDHTAGLVFNDSTANGYFYTITSSRLRDVKANFPVDKNVFTLRNLPVVKGMSATDGKGQVYFVLLYSESTVDSKFQATIAKIYRTDGLAWSTNYSLDMPPSELLYNADTGELSIKISNPSGENKIVVLDKTGKVVQ